MSVEISIKGGKVRFPGWTTPSFTTAWRRRIAPLVEEALKREAPVYKYDDPSLSRGQTKGQLRESIKLENAAGSTLVFSAVDYAKYVIRGTPGHPIPNDPEASKMLHWVRNGSSYYRREVYHPDTTPNDFPRRALDGIEPLIGRTLSDTIRELATPEQE